MSETLPSVDVIVSTFNEERYIERCLDAILRQTYPASAFTVWVIDGGSSDSTVRIVRRYASRHPNIRCIADGRRLNLPEALNLALASSSGDYVAKIDAHGYPEGEFLDVAVRALETGPPSLACVGGRPLQKGETAFGRDLALARTSPFGVGASGYAQDAPCGYVDTVQCGVYRRLALSSVGGFDAQMNYGEDEELNWRLKAAGYDIYLDSRMRFHYVTRATWISAFRQYYNYGRARVRVIEKHRDFARVYHAAPALLVSALFLAAPIALLSRNAAIVCGAALLLYLAAGLFASARCSGGRVTAVIGIASAFVALHAGYGAGTIAEICAIVCRRTAQRVNYNDL